MNLLLFRLRDFVFTLHSLSTDIKSRRKNLGMTQQQVAEAACISRQKVIAIERGEPTVAFGYYLKVADVLKINIKAEPARMPTLAELQKMNHGR
ncbi:helix-turn-helix transcriptional regulator [Chitinimonas sp. BJYL2]|uniref:helix-turn-helix transcriptional regulator n=1 Tax=Chitinimonas sp. BJYL2 TaxID=2976696 RepID=UPI0022B5C381|nr:helix-turn-helix domain-containing protein [Chitinimonas sp. BJYL2]